MDDSSGSPTNLDPSAKEFHPNPLFLTPAITFFPPPPQVFLGYPPPPPLPLPPFLQPPPPTYFYVRPPPSSTGPPSRTLLLTSTPGNVTEAIVRSEMEVFGEVRAVEMERLNEGIVTVHFYDLRASQNALHEIRAQHMHHHPLPPSFPAPGLVAGCPVWAQFVIPTFINSVADGHNHGTIVVFNLSSNISSETLKHIFEPFGPVKETRDTPFKTRQKFVEFFDVRDAARAAREMNGRVIHGKQIAIDFSRPGGGHGRQWSEFYQSNIRQLQSTSAPLPTFRKQVKNNNCTTPEENIFPAVADSAHRSGRCQARRPTKTTTVTGDDNHRSFINGDTTRARTDADTTASLRNADESNSGDCKNDAVSPVSSKAICRKVVGGNKFRLGRMKSSRLDSRFVIKEDVIKDSGDSRTTVMIKNIPNKYSQKLLLTLLDNHCAHCNDPILTGGADNIACLSSYDFVYLPMDFNNKCNVGYGFVNMTSPEATMRLYKAFHLQSWEVFNSRKICQVTYARVQGLEALKEHFRNSKFPTGSDEIFPVVFDPPRDGRRQMTPPQPVYGMSAVTSSSSSSENESSSSADDEQLNESGGVGAVDVDEGLAELRVEVDVTGVGRMRDQNGGCDGKDVVRKPSVKDVKQ